MLVTPNGNVPRNILSATVVKNPSGSPAAGTVLPGALKLIVSNSRSALKQLALPRRPDRSLGSIILME